jgi:hypothetical protein
MRSNQIVFFGYVLFAICSVHETVAVRNVGLKNNQQSDLNDERWADEMEIGSTSDDAQDDFSTDDMWVDRDNLARLLVIIQQKLDSASRNTDRLKRPSWAKTRRLNKKNIL